jgi:hypothetical protein
VAHLQPRALQPPAAVLPAHAAARARQAPPLVGQQASVVAAGGQRGSAAHQYGAAVARIGHEQGPAGRSGGGGGGGGGGGRVGRAGREQGDQGRGAGEGRGATRQVRPLRAAAAPVLIVACGRPGRAAEGVGWTRMKAVGGQGDSSRCGRCAARKSRRQGLGSGLGSGAGQPRAGRTLLELQEGGAQRVRGRVRVSDQRGPQRGEQLRGAVLGGLQAPCGRKMGSASGVRATDGAFTRALSGP